MTLADSSGRFRILEPPDFSLDEGLSPSHRTRAVLLKQPAPAVAPDEANPMHPLACRMRLLVSAVWVRFSPRRVYFGLKRRALIGMTHVGMWLKRLEAAELRRVSVQSVMLRLLGIHRDGSSGPPSRSSKDPYLVARMPPPEEESLPALRSPEPTLNELREVLHGHQATTVIAPVGLLPHDLDKRAVASESVVAVFPDLAQEFTDGYGPWTDTVAREAALWSHMARVVVFSNDHDRRHAVKRFGIPDDKTRIVSGTRITGATNWPAAARTERNWPEHSGLPERFLLGVDSRESGENTLLLFQALGVLRWRGFAFPPLVLVRPERRRFPWRISSAYEEALDRAMVSSDLRLGRDLFLASPSDERTRTELEAAASIAVITNRSSSDACRRVCGAAFRRCPVIACNSPSVEDEWGSFDAILSVPPDDSVALADAIQYTLTDGTATAFRVGRAYRAAQNLLVPPPQQVWEDLMKEIVDTDVALGKHDELLGQAG